MSLEDILQKIREETDLRKNSILEEAQSQADRRIEKAKRDLEQEMEQLRQQRKREIELEVQKQVAQTRLKGKNLLGQVKFEAVEELRAQLTQEFLQKIEGSYQDWCQKLIVNQAPSPKGEILMAPEEANRLGREFIERVNQERGTSFGYAGVTEEIERGFLIRQGGMLLDLSFSTLIDDFIRNNEGLITQMLFQEVES
ncbi:MAG: V/A-type H+/Na+-transporting ATPase subunit [Candidatus Atribacteria bacterium]|nr:V/A-type H+/Na+-transporting ATPase subunit [Candidatus Atribacteria bacterium]